MEQNITLKKRRTNNLCTICGADGIPGLIKGAGKCQYHWDLGAFSKEAADSARRRQIL